MASLRSSTRSTPRKKYTVDAFESIHDLLLESGSSTSGSGDEGEASNEDEEDDEEDDFQAGAEPSDADDDSMSGLDELGPLEEVDDAASGDGDFDLDDNISIADDSDHPRERSTHKGGRTQGKKPLKAPDGQLLYVRGALENLSGGQTYKRMAIFGPTPADWEPVSQAQKRWRYDTCLPNRQEENGRGGFAFADAYNDAIANVGTNWAWYTANGERFRQQQVLTPLSSVDAKNFLSVDGTSDRSFVMGPVAEQRLYNLKVWQFLALSEPFKHEVSLKTNTPGYKTGFVINLGARVVSLDWAPNRPGSKQYLAAAILPKRILDPELGESPFTPQKPHKSHIQIWEFSSTSDDYIDKNIPPRLSITLCTSIGDITVLKWCPVPRNDSHGLLACISGDGAVRVFDLSRPDKSPGASHLLIEKAAFTAKPPNTVATCLTWLSSSRIAVSCANGFVAVWDISKTTGGNPQPEILAPVSTTYITNIVTCYPSFPNMIAATNMAGYTTLTDLSQPNPAGPTGTAVSLRVRIAQNSLVWHDQSRSAISVEENMSVRALPLRRWFNSAVVGRMKSQATAMATSLCHPYVLIGGANGDVVAINPIDRIVGARSKLPKVQHQTWFAHEWRRPTDEEKQAVLSGEDGVKAVIGKDGLSRFVDGFKPHTVNLGPDFAGNRKDGIAFTTIYEEQSAVTALAWNPNLHVGGWAAAGMGDGLLRVEDIAL